MIYSLHIISLLFSTCSCSSVRYLAATRCRPLLLYLSIIYNLLYCSVCSGSMRETCCGSRMPVIIIYSLLFINLSIYIIYIDLLFSTCSGSMREASCTSMMPAILFIDLLFMYYLVFSACRSNMQETSCDSMMPAIIICYIFAT
jgi:hypothetical protein